MPSTILPPTWCPWSEWSRCSVEPCHSGILSSDEVDGKQPLDSISSNNTSVFCLDRLGLDDVVSSVNTDDGTKSHIKPQKQRRRICNCRFYNILRAIFSRCSEKNYIEVACKSCSPRERVYYGDLPILRLCSDISETSASTNLYHIIGGSLGVLAFFLLCVFCVRFAIAESSRVNRRRHRHRAELTEQNSCPTVTEFSPFVTELPPAYKDVIPLGSLSLIDSETPPSFHAFDNSTRVPELPEDRNLPPAYQEVIAVSPTAAEMRQSVLLAKRLRAEEQEESAIS